MKSFKPENQKVGVICDMSRNRGIVEKLQRPAFSIGVRNVKAGEKIATVYPPTLGVDGFTVTGEILKAYQLKPFFVISYVYKILKAHC